MKKNKLGDNQQQIGNNFLPPKFVYRNMDDNGCLKHISKSNLKNLTRPYSSHQKIMNKTLPRTNLSLEIEKYNEYKLNSKTPIKADKAYFDKYAISIKSEEDKKIKESKNSFTKNVSEKY